MTQIGRLAGVSQSTVSRILNGVEGSVRVSPETRERVFEAVRRLGYRPNPLARGLRGARTAMIGLVVREEFDPFFSALVAALGVEARRHSHNLVLGYAQSRVEDAAEIAWVLETRHCDGILLLGDLRDQLPPPEPGGRPMLALCVGERAIDVPVLNTDNAAGAEFALEHLWGLGHRRIGFVDAAPPSSLRGGSPGGDVRERLSRYLEFCVERSLPRPAEYVRQADNDPRGGHAAATALLRLPEPPTAIFASTDTLAIGALKAAADAGLRVPEDLSIVGFDDIPLTEFVTPALTTVRQPVPDLAALAIADLLAMVANPAYEPEPVRRLRPALVVRESTAPAPTGT
jgi:DNA-binding LacI/PurR family transcriptional regulator